MRATGQPYPFTTFCAQPDQDQPALFTGRKTCVQVILQWCYTGQTLQHHKWSCSFPQPVFSFLPLSFLLFFFLPSLLSFPTVSFVNAFIYLINMRLFKKQKTKQKQTEWLWLLNDNNVQVMGKHPDYLGQYLYHTHIVVNPFSVRRTCPHGSNLKNKVFTTRS